MGLFLRKRDRSASASQHDAAAESPQDPDDTAAVVGPGDPTMSEDGPVADAAQSDPQVGPFDASQVPTKEGFVDLGAIRLPGIQGLVMSMEMDQASGDVTAVRIHLGESQLQLQAFAAPRSVGIWDEIRGEIAEGLDSQGGSSQEEPGPFGTELVVRMPGRGADGRAVTTAMRFVGIDRPRWFLRGVISGPAATDAAQCAVSGSTPSRRASTSAIAGAEGVHSPTTRQRERIVTDTSSGWVDGAQSRKTVCSAGSSTALSSAFEAPSVSRSASSISTIW